MASVQIQITNLYSITYNTLEYVTLARMLYISLVVVCISLSRFVFYPGKDQGQKPLHPPLKCPAVGSAWRSAIMTQFPLMTPITDFLSSHPSSWAAPRHLGTWAPPPSPTICDNMPPLPLPTITIRGAKTITIVVDSAGLPQSLSEKEFGAWPGDIEKQHFFAIIFILFLIASP